jgi:hypothetical protein
MSAPIILPLIPAGPEIEPAERDRAAECLQALQSRLPKLLFAAPRSRVGIASLTRLARQINGYLDVTGATLRELTPPGPAGLPDRRATADAQAGLTRIAADVDRLIGVLDTFLADPDAEARRLALEEAVTQVTGNLPEGPRAWPGQRQPPQAEANRAGPAAGEPSPASLRPFAVPAGEGWRDPLLQGLRRQTHLALGLAGLALVLVIAGFALDHYKGRDDGQGAWPDPGFPGVNFGTPLPGPPPQGGREQEDRSLERPNPTQVGGGAEALAPGQASSQGDAAPGVTGDGLARQRGGWLAEGMEGLAQVPRRQAELELEVLYLRARLEALEKQQVAADRARARAQNAAEGE